MALPAILANHFHHAGALASALVWSPDALIEQASREGASIVVGADGEAYVSRLWGVVYIHRAHAEQQRLVREAELASNPARRLELDRLERIAVDVARQHQAERAAAIQAEQAALSKESK